MWASPQPTWAPQGLLCCPAPLLGTGLGCKHHAEGTGAFWVRTSASRQQESRGRAGAAHAAAASPSTGVGLSADSSRAVITHRASGAGSCKQVSYSAAGRWHFAVPPGLGKRQRLLSLKWYFFLPCFSPIIDPNVFSLHFNTKFSLCLCSVRIQTHFPAPVCTPQ